MKLLAYLKITLKGIIREFPGFLLSYGIYPIVIGLVMGYVQKDMFTPVINDPIFSIVIQDEDNTTGSRNLTSFLNSEEISKILTIKSNDEKFDYTLRIPKGYEDSLLGKEPATVKVEAEEKSSTTMGNILVNLVDKYNKEVSQGLFIEKNIANSSLSGAEKEKLIAEINTILVKTYGTDSIKTNIHKVRKNLNSFEYYSVTFLSFAFIIFIMAVISSDAIEKENGLYSRIMSTSMSKLQFFNYGIMSNYLTMLVANFIYVFGYRISGLSFQGPLSTLILIVLVQSLMITTIGTLISTLFKKKYGLPIVQIFLMFQMVFGGMLGPLYKTVNNKVFLSLSKFKPDILIQNSFRHYLLDGSLSSVSNYLIIMLALSLTLYIFNILAIHMKWGVQK